MVDSYPFWSRCLNNLIKWHFKLFFPKTAARCELSSAAETFKATVTQFTGVTTMFQTASSFQLGFSTSQLQLLDVWYCWKWTMRLLHHQHATVLLECGSARTYSNIHNTCVICVFQDVYVHHFQVLRGQRMSPQHMKKSVGEVYGKVYA